MRRLFKKGVLLLVVMSLLVGGMSVTTFAATKKTVKKAKFDTSTSILNKKATAVKKGTSNLTIKKGQGYIKFTAPKTKKYTITFSKFKSSYGSNAFVEIQTPDSFYPAASYLTKVKTKGGKSDVLWLSMNGYSFSDTKLIGRPIPKRAGTIKLKKGQNLFMYIYAGSKKTTAQVNIK